MSQGQGKDRPAGERETAVRHDGAGHDGAGHDEPRPERPLSMSGPTEVLGKHGGPAITPPQHHKPPRKAAKAAGPKPAKTQPKTQPKAPGPGKGRPTPKQSAKQAPKQGRQQGRQQSRPAAKGRSRAGRPDGPLARRRRLRIRLLVVLWLVVNVAAGVIWQDWKASLAVFVLSILITPLLGALLLRRR